MIPEGVTTPETVRFLDSDGHWQSLDTGIYVDQPVKGMTTENPAMHHLIWCRLVAENTTAVNKLLLLLTEKFAK